MSRGARRSAFVRRCAAALLLGACAPAPPPSAPAAAGPRVRDLFPAAASPCGLARRERAERPRSIAPDERVPEFVLATASCEVVDSRELVGQRAFVVVFFTSWCAVCEHRVPLVRDALLERAEVVPLWVSLDDADDASSTDAFLERHALAPRSAIAGRDFLDFSFGYNPFRSVPVVVVVGRGGRVVAVQIGVRDGDDAVLAQALDEAVAQAADPAAPPPLTSAPRP